MSEFAIPIFPDGSAASTVTATVWLGVVIVVWTNLRFGWCMSGLVVPGYLVPLMLIRPTSVAVMLFEAVVTYLIVRAISDPPRNWPYWCSFFGRDRFFALVLVSVAVRVACDGYLFPWLGQYVNDSFGLHFNYHDQMHSVGLVVVALIANYFWKPGLVRGTWPLAITIFATFVVVRYLLIPYTTFDISSLRYVYEDIASSLLASPKAYMVLLTTAYFASHMNLRFSWEYNGILIPALTALLWCEPTKICATFLESLVILLVACLVLKLPIFRRINVQGSRKVLLFFTVAFAYRLSLSWLTSIWAPEFKATDFYGFGYLLSTLLANRFHEKGHAVRTVVATTYVAFGGALMGSCIGYVLLFAPDPFRQAVLAEQVSIDQPASADFMQTVRNDKLRLYAQPMGRQYDRVTRAEVRIFQAAIRLLQEQAAEDRHRAVHQANRSLSSIAYEVLLFEDKYAYFRDQDENRGRGMFVLNLGRPDGMLISVPEPAREPYTLEAGFCLFRDLQASVLAVAGASPLAFGESMSGGVQRHSDLFDATHRLYGQRKTLQIRGYTEAAAAAFGVKRTERDDFIDRGQNCLWVTGGLPEGIQLSGLQQLLGSFDIRWESSPTRNASRKLVAPGFAELYLNRRVRTSLYSRFVVAKTEPRPDVDASKPYGHIVRWLLDRKATIAAAGSQRYVPAQLEEMLMMDQEVLQPLLALLRNPQSPDRKRTLRVINSAASLLDYAVLPFVDETDGRRYLILTENTRMRRCWGTYVFAEDPRTPLIWEVPRPIIEVNAYEFGVDTFHDANAIAFLAPGAHLESNRDGSADVTRVSNKLTLFNLVHQALLREYSGRSALVVQARAMKDPVDADVVLTTDENARSTDDLSPLKSLLCEQIRAGLLEVAFVDGSDQYAGYELGNTAQWLSIQQASQIELVTAWLSPTLRWQYRQQSQNEPLLAQLYALEIPSTETNVIEYLCVEMELSSSPVSRAQQQRLLDLVWTYLESRDVIALQLLAQHPYVEQLRHLIDANTQQAFLHVTTTDSGPLLVNLAELREGIFPPTVIGASLEDSVRTFVETRAPLLVQECAP